MNSGQMRVCCRHEDGRHWSAAFNELQRPRMLVNDPYRLESERVAEQGMFVAVNGNTTTRNKRADVDHGAVCTNTPGDGVVLDNVLASACTQLSRISRCAVSRAHFPG